MDCDVVLLPDITVAQKAITASKQLGTLGSLFELEDGKYFPHVSLYMMRLRFEDTSQVEELLHKLATETKSETWKALKYGFSRGYVIVDYEVTRQTSILQQQVIQAVNPLRDGILAKDRDSIKEATGLALQNYETYGYKYVGELFHPHITLTRFSEDREDAEKLLPEISEFDGSFTKLGLFELGKNNTCVQQLAVFELRA